MVFLLGYVTNILEDARVYSEHAQKKEIDISDVKLAVQTRMDHSFTAPPPREVRKWYN
jgi:histone H3/H4